VSGIAARYSLQMRLAAPLLPQCCPLPAAVPDNFTSLKAASGAFYHLD